MYEPLTETEIQFCELYNHPTSLTENLWPQNENAPQTWNDECDCITLRPYQIMMQDFSYLVEEDEDLSAKQNMRKKIGAGKIYNIGARNLGKSFILKINTVLSVIHKVKEMCIASFNAQHLRDVCNPIASYIEAHPFLKVFHLRKETSKAKTVKRNDLTIITEHGALVKSANELVEGNNPGVQFHGKHYEKLEYEEQSYATDEGTQKRVDSGSRLGYIERLSGIPDIRIGSPLTKILNNPANKRYVWRQPQYVARDWDKKTEEEKIEKYGGKSSMAYRLNVEAELVEGAFGFWDMERLKQKCLKKDRRIKYFEINKDNFREFENRIIVESLSGAEQTFISADLGYGNRPTEITVIFKVGNKYKYVYNISLFKLIREEQAEIFCWLYQKLGGGFIALDNTNDHNAICDLLCKRGIPRDQILLVNFNSNIEIDFEKDDKGIVQRDTNGEPIMRKEHTMHWAMSELEKLIYGGFLEIPVDQKFLKEFNGFLCKQTGMKKSYGTTTTDDLHQSFQVFAISRFFNEFNVQQSLTNVKRCWGIM